MDKSTDGAACSVQVVEVTENNDEQRLDNFLLARLKGVPRSLIYRIVRKGEVRVNKGRVDVSHRLAVGDQVRIPPVRLGSPAATGFVPAGLRNALSAGVLFEDDHLLVLNKPSGFAVHGGSGVSAGVIEGLRVLRPEAKLLELVHRLDKDTSGCLLIAKKRSALKHLHEQFRQDLVRKTYLALLAGQWARRQQQVDAPLQRNILHSGERMVAISKAGKSAQTLFRRLRLYAGATWVEAAPKTGRTHQIRVHAASLGHPIVGDDRYGDDAVNRSFKNKGYNRMILHAATLVFQHPATGAPVTVTAPLPKPLAALLADEKPV